MTTTFNKLHKIQTEQLAQWANVLKPEIHAVLVQKVNGMTRQFAEPDREVDFDYVSDCVPRGGTIDGIVHNLAMDVSRFEEDKNNSLIS